MKFFLSQTKYISPTTFEVQFLQLRKVLRYQRAINRRTDNAVTKRKKGQTIIYKTLHRKQKIE